MSGPTAFVRVLPFLALLATTPVAAQEHRHATAGDTLGTVHFATSCRAEVAPRFDRGVALLHSFEFGAAIEAFEQVLAADSTCAMAHWGIAMARWTNPMSATLRPPALLAKGRTAAQTASRPLGKVTPRERGWIAAVATLFDDFEKVDQATRVARYERAMAELVARQPADTEAKIFHAIALVAAAAPTDKSYANQRRAGAILESLWAAQPDHPGLAHYIIHAYDVPALAKQAAAAAQRYAAIAPSAAHALHMPSHTFTRLGMWDASVRTNRRSADVAIASGAIAEALHAFDYQVYAYLQMRRDTAAREVLDGLPPLAAKFDPGAVTGAAPGSAGVFALAAMPARWALERRAWPEAAALTPASTPFPWADAVTWFARALGASRVGQLRDAHAAIDTLGAMQARLAASGEAYWAEQVAIQRLGAQAWVALAEGRQAEALDRMREAAQREDATEKSAVTPGPLAPARELLGDMLLELQRPSVALAEYRKTLEREPNRYRTLDGARRAALAAGDKAAAAQYQRELDALTGARVASGRP